MKKLIILTAITFLSAVTTFATDPEMVNIQIGEQKVTTTGKITVNFIEVMEDSRCPANVNCIWAGNARVKISLKRGRSSAKTFELNSTLDPRVIVFDCYEISFGGLTPRPGEEAERGAASVSTLTISIAEHKK